MVTYLLNGMFLCNGNARSKRVSSPLKHTYSIDRRVVITSGVAPGGRLLLPHHRRRRLPRACLGRSLRRHKLRHRLARPTNARAVLRGHPNRCHADARACPSPVRPPVPGCGAGVRVNVRTIEGEGVRR